MKVERENAFEGNILADVGFEVMVEVLWVLHILEKP